MNLRRGAVWVCLLLVTIAPAVLPGAEPAKPGGLTEGKLGRLLRDMNANDIGQQLPAVVELEKVVDNATPADLALLRARAIGPLKAGIQRERVGRMGRPEIAAMMQRILVKIARGGAAPPPPTDLPTRAKKVAHLLAQLAGKDELAKRRALGQARGLKALGAPALPAARHLAKNSADPYTRQAALMTVNTMTKELWFDSALAGAAAAPPAKADAKAVESQLAEVVRKLAARVDTPPDSQRIRAIRQLMMMKASALGAVDKLAKAATDRTAPSAVRRAAAVALRALAAAKAESAQYYEWQKKHGSAPSNPPPSR